MWEDQGSNITDTILGMNGELKNSKDNMDGLNKAVESTDANPMVQLKGAVEDLKVAIEPLVKKLAEFVTGLAEVIKKTTEWIKENPEVVDTIMDIVTALIAFKSGTKAFNFIKNIPSMIGGVVGALNPLTLAIGLVCGAVALWVKNWDGIKLGLQALWEYLTEFVDWLVNTVVEDFNKIVTFFSNCWTIIKTVAIEKWESLKEWFSETWDIIADNVSTAWNNIKNFFSETWNSIKETASDIWDGIKNFFSDTWDTITNTISNVWNGIVNFLTGIWNGIKNTISNVWNGICNFIGGIMDSIWSTIVGIWDSIVNGVSGALSGIWDGVTGVWNDVIGWLEGINLFDIGVNIISGMVDGVCSMAGSLWDSVCNTVDSAIEGAKEWLGIASPSKVFAEIGQYTGEGFIVGMEDMQKEVSKAGQKMANASIPDLPKTNRLAGAVSEAQGTVLYATNITYLDGKEIARETTKKVISNIDRTQNSKMKGRGY